MWTLSLSIRGVDEGRDMQRPPSVPGFLSTHKTEEEVGSAYKDVHKPTHKHTLKHNSIFEMFKSI